MPDVADIEIEDIMTREVLGRGIAVHARAAGPSMCPLIRDGDRVLIEPGSAADLRIGDVVLYRNEGHYIIHRLVKKAGPGTVITRGDNRTWDDPPVPVGNIMGTVVQIEGRGRRVALTGTLGRRFARTIAWLATSRVRGKRLAVWNLDRLWWLIRGRRLA
jgi:signal peptidase I